MTVDTEKLIEQARGLIAEPPGSWMAIMERPERLQADAPYLLRALADAVERLTAERDEARVTNNRLMRINGGLRGKASGEDDHWCAVEGCQNEPTMYEFTSDEFVCDTHVYYGAENPETARAESAEADRDRLAAALRETREEVAANQRTAEEQQLKMPDYSEFWRGREGAMLDVGIWLDRAALAAVAGKDE